MSLIAWNILFDYILFHIIVESDCEFFDEIKINKLV